jgi:NAD(P)-dependent dehydrogenase (short-subunit alcohol dehydrogenase family)
MAARYSLQGKTVLVTGAARGIGAEASRQAAGRGARVVCVGLEPELLDEVARACGNGALALEADVSDAEAVARAVAAAVQETGGIDVVVANAGIGTGAPVTHLPPAAFERVIRVNVLGTYNTVHACLPHVIERRGYVLPVASLAAPVPYFPGLTAYAASKAAVEAFGRALSTEVSHLGVDVGVAYFGWIATDLVHGAEEESAAYRLVRSRMKGPAGRTYPVSDAGRAIVRGIESRASVVAAPGWIRAVLRLRGFIGPLAKREMSSSAPEAMALFEAEYQRAGAESVRPLGAGGRADTEAVRGGT